MSWAGPPGWRTNTAVGSAFPAARLPCKARQPTWRAVSLYSQRERAPMRTSGGVPPAARQRCVARQMNAEERARLTDDVDHGDPALSKCPILLVDALVQYLHAITRTRPLSASSRAAVG
jgi:hypothetical protein